VIRCDEAEAETENEEEESKGNLKTSQLEHEIKREKPEDGVEGGEFHDQGDAKWIVIRRQFMDAFWGANPRPAYRPPRD
jgi:hypothetical protein